MRTNGMNQWRWRVCGHPHASSASRMLALQCRASAQMLRTFAPRVVVRYRASNHAGGGVAVETKAARPVEKRCGRRACGRLVSRQRKVRLCMS